MKSGAYNIIMYKFFKFIEYLGKFYKYKESINHQ